MSAARIIIISVGVMALLRFWLFVISVAASRQAYREPTIADLEYELKEIRRRRMEREKKRSMK